MNTVHASNAAVCWKARRIILGAAEQDAEVLVQMRQKETNNQVLVLPRSSEQDTNILLIGRRVIGRHVVHERSRATAVEEVLRDGRVRDEVEYRTVVGRDIAAVEIRE